MLFQRSDEHRRRTKQDNETGSGEVRLAVHEKDWLSRVPQPVQRTFRNP